MRILVALDGSENSFNALRSACTLAGRLYAPVTALYVNVGEEYTAEATRWLSVRERIAASLESFGNETLQKAYTIGKEAGVSVEGIIASGIPHVEILNYAASRGIVKLIVMGHSSRGTGAVDLVESTTKSIIAASPVPVFVTSSESEIRTILIAVDISEASRRVVAFGGKLAKALGAPVTILSVAPYADDLINEYRIMSEALGIANYSGHIDKDYMERAERAFTSARETLDSLRVPASFVLRRGHPPDAIIKEARHYDAVIIGVKEKPGQRRLSSVATRLLNHRISAIYVQ